jgi:murein DD-endopeptidase MepM/ murein hydrolase activator NlpD
MHLLVTLALLTAPMASDWQSPLPGDVVVARGFDPPAQRWLPGNRGVDLLGSPGEQVLAAGAGTVSYAGTVATVPVVAIRHPDGLETTYEPVVAVVKRGQAVRAGQPIGRLVTAGSHCPPQACLHWGLKRAGNYLDPLGLLGLERVRLLPMGGPSGPARVAPATVAGALGAASLAYPLTRRRARSRRSTRSTTANPPAQRRRARPTSR